MRIQSPLSKLCDVLNQVKGSATQYQETLRKNEAATRAVLIDPVLRAVGWETANTYMVEVEKMLGQTRVDYALFDTNGDVRVIVEAKPLGGNLTHQSIIMKLVTYAFTYGLQDIFLTDGLIWQHFTDFQPGKVAPTKILNLGEDNFVDCAAYLVHRLDAAKFWPETQTIDTLAQQVAQLESIVSTLQRDLTNLKNVAGNFSKANLSEDIEHKSAVSINASPTLSYVDLTNVSILTKKKPVSLRLPDGTEAPVRQWKDILPRTPPKRAVTSLYVSSICQLHKKHDAGTVAFRRHGEASSASGFGSQAECRHNLPHSFR
jgi:predicted type IV restriction endonuclease